MLPVKEYDPNWTLCVLEDLKIFFESNDMEKSAAAVSRASLVVAGEIQEIVDNQNTLCLPRAGLTTH